MQVSVEITSSIERKLSIGVDSTEVDKIFKSKLKLASTKVRLNGFRPGKIPLSEIKKRFGKSIRRESITEVIDLYYRKAIEDQEIRPVGMPKIERVIDEPGTDFKFEAVVEVWPEMNLPSLDDLSVDEPHCDVDDAAIDKMLLKMQNDRAEWEEAPDGREAESGDQVVVDFDGKINQEAFEGGAAEDFELELGAGKMIPGFDEGILGHKVGDACEVKVTFPDDYAEKDLQGKEAIFDVKVKSCKVKKLPEIDEAFVKASQIESGSVDDLRQALAENMGRECELALANRFKENVADAILEKADFKAPQVLIDEESERMKDAAIRNFGGDPEQMKNLIPSAMFKDRAESSVKKGILFQEYIRKFELQIDESKVQEHLKKIASRYEDPSSVMNQFMENKDFMNSTHSQLLEDDFVELVRQKSSLTQVQLEFSELVDNRGR